MEILFIYSKNGEIKVLNIEQAKAQHNQLTMNKWEHVKTLNPCVFLEYLFEKDDSEIIKSIRMLDKR